MAFEIPKDLPRNDFTRIGLMTLDGEDFESTGIVSSEKLQSFIVCTMFFVKYRGLQARCEWAQVRNICLLYYLSGRTKEDREKLRQFLHHVGILDTVDQNQPQDILDNATRILSEVEAMYNQAEVHLSVQWVEMEIPRPFPSLTNTSIVTSTPTVQQDSQNSYLPVYTVLKPSNDDSVSKPTTPVTDFNTNPKFQGKYNFTDHRQEYEGFQFQCIFRCLKDGKHCRKAPVREMNRHLRDRHHFRQGFKIAGVDWEKKRWRGAGAGHEECVGMIVEKDSTEDEEDCSEGEGYVVQ